MDKALFMYLVSKKKDTLEGVASALNVRKQTLYAKLRGDLSFSLADIRIIKARWALSDEELNKIFLI